MIDESERDDFRNAILSKGLNQSDFELVEIEEPMRGVEVQPIKGHVMIKRKSTGVHQTYRSGHRSHWAADFEEDLKLGIFD